MAGFVLDFLWDSRGKMKRYCCFVSVSAFFFNVLGFFFIFKKVIRKFSSLTEK